MERTQRCFNLFILGPLLLAPVLAVDFPRVLAFLPIISAIFGALILHCGLKERLRFPNPLLVFFGGACALIAASLLWAADFDTSFSRFTKLITILPFYALYLSVAISGAQYINKNTPVYVIISSGLAAAFMSLDLSLDSVIYRYIRGLPADELLNTAVFNRGAVAIVCLALAAFLSVSKKTSMINGVALVPILLMLTLVQSQSAQLVAIVGIGFYALFPTRRPWAWIAVFIAIAASIIAKPFLAIMLYGNIPQSVLDMPFIKGGSLWHRMEIWAFVSGEILKHPLLGQGLEVTKTIEHNFSVGNNTILHPHSLILQIWIELGALGVMATIAAIAGFMKLIYKTLEPDHSRAALACFITLFAVANVSYGLWQAWWLGLFVLLAGMLIISTKMKETSISNPD